MSTRRLAHNRVDMTGKVYNSWEVVTPDLEKSKGKALYWKAKCLECGEIYSVWGANIRSGLSKRCINCGCGHTHEKQKGQTRTKRTSIESAHYYLYLKLRKDAKKRGHAWALSEAEVKELVLKHCTYCKRAPSLLASPLKHMGMSQRLTKDASFLRGGVDRVDSTKGYIEGNVVPCCQQCNNGKLDYTKEEFLEWVKLVYEANIKAA